MGARQVTVLLLTIWLFWIANARAHDGHPENSPSDAFAATRDWTWVARGETFSGTFLTCRESNVILRRSNGRVISVPLGDLTAIDRQWVDARLEELSRLNGWATFTDLSQTQAMSETVETALKSSVPEDPPLHRHFRPFEKRLGLRWDDQFYYVESDGMPEHSMMVGITSWQQQVPLPQRYTGANAWRIPLHPVPAKQPKSAKTGFFRGAIALAVNGVPIFNPIKNDGKTDTFLAGELDQWGGHCGRGDDYHYHLPPVHLEKIVGAGNPIAYALDGYPILGYQDERAPDYAELDSLNGHCDAQGHYHYHATRTYPYLNGGFYGEVVERDGQVDPQPRAQSPRPALRPLKGARISGFERSSDGKSVRVVYELQKEQRSVSYSIHENGSLVFSFDNGSEGSRQETFSFANKVQSGGKDRPDGGAESPRSRRQSNLPPETASDSSQTKSPRGKQPERAPSPRDKPDVARRPWIEVHASEMDRDQNHVLSAVEVEAEVDQAFSAYDTNKDGKVPREEMTNGKPVRSALGGFLREHFQELDGDGNSELTRDEVTRKVLSMFRKADADADGNVPIHWEGSLEPKPGPSSSPPKPDRQSPSAPHTSPPGRTPNIVLILMDDMGWRDVGFTGNSFVETPHLDRLAREGLQFTQAYASAPNCAPTRACLLSGQYTPRHGVYTVIDPRHDPGQPHHRILSAHSNESLPTETVTLAEVLKKNGYATAGFGMWNLGRGRQGPTTPTGQGFDEFQRPQDLGFAPDAYFASDGRYLTDVLFAEGMRFIADHQRQPFFLYLPTHAIHAPFEPQPELLKKYQEKAQRVPGKSNDPVYAAMIESVDKNVGRLLAQLQQLGLDDNTLVVFTSDNGGTPQYVAPLKGSKGALYEGGIRVPCAIWWKGIQNPGRKVNVPMLSMDLYPTLAEITGAQIPAGHLVDGVSLVPILRQSGPIQRDTIFWHFPCYIGRGEPCSAVRSGPWKLLQKFEGPSFELYHLEDDPGETRNLAETHPQKTEELKEVLKQWQAALHAPSPSEPNPAFDPSQSPRRGEGRKGNRSPQNRKDRLTP